MPRAKWEHVRTMRESCGWRTSQSRSSGWAFPTMMAGFEPVHTSRIPDVSMQLQHIVVHSHLCIPHGLPDKGRRVCFSLTHTAHSQRWGLTTQAYSRKTQADRQTERQNHKVDIDSHFLSPSISLYPLSLSTHANAHGHTHTHAHIQMFNLYMPISSYLIRTSQHENVIPRISRRHTAFAWDVEERAHVLQSLVLPPIDGHAVDVPPISHATHNDSHLCPPKPKPQREQMQHRYPAGITPFKQVGRVSFDRLWCCRGFKIPVRQLILRCPRDDDLSFPLLA
jgi:hypothetical protein